MRTAKDRHPGSSALLLIPLFCLLAAPAVAQPPVPDHVEAVVSGDQLTIRHLNAFYNCCQDAFVYSVQWVGPDLLVTEREEPPGGLCDCLCHFDLEVVLLDLPPGPLHVDFSYLDEGWVTVPLDVVIGDEAQDGTPEIGPVLKSDCHEGHVVTIGTTTWGALKRRYR